MQTNQPEKPLSSPADDEEGLPELFGGDLGGQAYCSRMVENFGLLAMTRLQLLINLHGSLMSFFYQVSGIFCSQPCYVNLDKFRCKC